MTEGKRICENCGIELGPAANFCSNCGTVQSPEPEVPPGPPPLPPEPARISTPTDPSIPPPPPQAGGRNWIKIIAIGCGGLAILFLLLVGGCAALIGFGGGFGGSFGGSANTTGSSANKEESEQSALGVGEGVDVDGANWYITSAEPRTQLDDQFGTGQSKQGNFVVVDFRFTNNGTESKTLTPNAMALIDTDERRYEPDTDTFSYIPTGKDIFLEQVNPGVGEDGEVIFSVAPGASGFTLELSNTNPLRNDKAYVDLGF